MQVTPRERSCRYFPPSGPTLTGGRPWSSGRARWERAQRVHRSHWTSLHQRTTPVVQLLTLPVPGCQVAASPRRSSPRARAGPGVAPARMEAPTRIGRAERQVPVASPGSGQHDRPTGDSRHPGPRTPSTPPLSATAPSARPSSISHASSPVRAVPGLLHRAQPQRARSEHIGAHDDLHHGAARCRRS
jgi:hypothetical protein